MPKSLLSPYLPWRISDIPGKVSTIVNFCFYQIAMGKWPPGSRLPAVRRLEADWSVNRMTILKAFSLLAAKGLINHKPNGGYYVSEQGARRTFARDRLELESLYEEVVAKIARETDLSPLGVLRMLVRIAESKSAENPGVAFVECSRSQAAGHAREIMERLHVPVLPLTLEEIRGKKTRIPSAIKVVFTTSFHVDELMGLKKAGADVVALPIEISHELLAEIARRRKEVVFLESDELLARRTAKDAIWMMGIEKPRVEIVPGIQAFLSAFAESHKHDMPRTLFLIAQKEWENLEAKWRDHASVAPITCTLSDAAWPLIIEAVKLPFGALA